jgi:uncharacterized protein (TIGR03083 family)
MTEMPFPATAYLPHLRELTADFAAVLADADPAAKVPYCEGWTLADLGTHLGNVHRWAALIVRTGEVQDQYFEQSPGSALAPWYAESAEILLDTLGQASPEEPCWAFGATAKVKGFWFRRQVQETAVHLVDAHRAAGGGRTLDPAVAADGVDEVLTAMLPRVNRWYSAPPLAAPLALRATDTGDVWTLHPGEPPALGPAVEPAATAEASAQDLVLLLWKRVPLDTVRITGDASVATGFLSAPMTP